MPNLSFDKVEKDSRRSTYWSAVMVHQRVSKLFHCHLLPPTFEIIIQKFENFSTDSTFSNMSQSPFGQGKSLILALFHDIWLILIHYYYDFNHNLSSTCLGSLKTFKLPEFYSQNISVITAFVIVLIELHWVSESPSRATGDFKHFQKTCLIKHSSIRKSKKDNVFK